MKNKKISGKIFSLVAQKFQTPLYLYNEQSIIQKCKELLSMSNAFGIRVRYAMKANSNKTILQIISGIGLHIDASSQNEAIRAKMAGIPYKKIMLTTQEVPQGEDRKKLEKMMHAGLKYNVCSLQQLELISDFASKNKIPLSVRIHPGTGSGESSTRNTGDKYSCFGIHLSDIEKALSVIKNKKLKIDTVHVHIGSGGDPKKWKENIDREIGFLEKYFPDATTVNFGGGLKESRMPGEIHADIKNLGIYAKKKMMEFYKKTGRKLLMEIEPGTYVIANSGYIITSIIDIKRTGEDGFEFLILDGGMEMNARPILYGSKHPFTVVSKNGKILSEEKKIKKSAVFRIVVGRCCESGDSQSLDSSGNIVPRKMANANIGDYIIIGGCGAYCSSMTPFNYNSHEQAPEILLTKKGRLELIRKKQTLQQLIQNEI